MVKLIDELKQAIAENSFKNQQEIADWFLHQGRTINQSTISRALQKINALKRINGDGAIEYQIPREYKDGNVLENLNFLIKELSFNESVIVIKTESGSASVISELIDKRNHEYILSTIAGENTVLIIPISIHYINDIVSELQKVLELNK